MTATPEFPLEWKSHKWWANRPEADRLAFIGAPERTVQQALAGWKGKLKGSEPGAYPLFEVNNLMDGGGGLIITGYANTGKSVLAYLLAAEAIKGGNVSARWVATDKYVEMLKDTFDTADGNLPGMWSSPYMLKYLKNVFDLVIIDGVGQERQTEFAHHEVGSLIRERWENMKPTIVTTHLKLHQLPKTYGARIATALSGYSELEMERNRQ